MTKGTTLTIVSLIFIGIVSVIMYHQLNAQEVVVIEPTYIQEEVLYEPPPLDTKPDYDIITPSSTPSSTFGEAFARARYNLGNDTTFFWNGDEYHTRTVEEDIARLLLASETPLTVSTIDDTPVLDDVPVIEVEVEVESTEIDSTEQ